MSVYKRIIVGTDGSATSMLAVDRAGKIAGESGPLIVSAYRPESRAVVKSAGDALGDDAYIVVGSAPAEAALRKAAVLAVVTPEVVDGRYRVSG